MSDTVIEVAIVVLLYNGQELIGPCLDSVFSAPEPSIESHVVVVDNGSMDDGPSLIQNQYPQVHLVSAASNLGFAAGNNLGFQSVRNRFPQTRYLALLNQDTVVTPGWLTALVNHLEQHDEVASAQAKLMQAPRTDRFNSAGNRNHFLGFGFVSAYDEVDHGQYDRPRSIDYASGAAVLIRRSPLDEIGLFDDQMFMYLEDADLSWKLRMIGFDSVFVPDSVVYHWYGHDHLLDHFHHLERNRWWLLLSYYKWQTLLLLSPLLVLTELGIWWFALRHRLAGKKWLAYREIFGRSFLRRLFDKRRKIQSRRIIDDRSFMVRFSGKIDYPPLNRSLMLYVGNPILAVCWWFLRLLIRW